MREERIYDKLCSIDDTSRATALSAEATVFCGQCGAEAYDPASVCDPVNLGTRKSGGSGTPQRGR